MVSENTWISCEVFTHLALIFLCRSPLIYSGESDSYSHIYLVQAILGSSPTSNYRNFLIIMRSHVGNEKWKHSINCKVESSSTPKKQTGPFQQLYLSVHKRPSIHQPNPQISFQRVTSSFNSNQIPNAAAITQNHTQFKFQLKFTTRR